jgi:prepilin-type processing-associated H-X9-DG protein
LIELLVVVAIIALLVTILMPSLSRAKELAKQAVCASHQHSIGLAIWTYAAEFDNIFPGAVGRISSSHPDASVREGGHHTWRHWFQYLWGPQYHILVMDEGTHPGWGEYGTQETGMIRCPKSTSGKYGLYASDNVDAHDLTADGVFMDVTHPPLWNSSYGFTRFLMDKCPSPDNFLFVGCTTDGDPLDQSYYAFQWWVTHSNVGRRPNMGLWLTHSETVNGLFVDGHVESCGSQTLQNTANERPRRAWDPDWGGPGIKEWLWEDGTFGP